MKRNDVLTLGQVLIAVFMILSEGVFADKFIITPIMTGFVLLIIVWFFSSLKRK
jgi:hypothetical protein|tara:strand:+ start:444 stop:605 length:162 start_codon:yes stop_codon:yes gene_type:complete